MQFKGYVMTFSTVGNKQYETIGNIWDKLSELYGVENLRGLGFGWTDTSISYSFGFKEDLDEEEYLKRLDTVNTLAEKPFRYNVIDIPDDAWETYKGTTNALDVLYEDVYAKGSLDFEIETFNSDGTCSIDVHYIVKDEGKLNKVFTQKCVAEFLAILFDIVSVAATICYAYTIYLVATTSLKAGFMTIGLPFILLLLIWFIHCGLLVNRVNKRKEMAQLVLNLRLSKDERDHMAAQYKVSKFVDDMVDSERKIR